jgi:hypothetical protein
LAVYWFVQFLYFFSAVEEGGEENGSGVGNNDLEAANSDSGSVANNDVDTASVGSDRDVTLPTLESLEPESNG